LDGEKITKGDREIAKELCRSLNIYDDTRMQTAQVMRIRKIKGFIDTKKGEHTEELIIEQEERIKKLQEENSKLKEQLGKYKVLEKEAKGVRKRWFELESKRLLLRKRLEAFTKEESKETSINLKKKDDKEFERLAELSDDEYENIEDEGIRKAFKENREKMDVLKKEIRLFFAQSNPGLVDIRSKIHKKPKEGKYDYSEDIN